MKVWLCYANVGGGHRGAAHAIADAFAEKKEKVEITYVDLAGGLGPTRRTLFEGGYAWLIDRADWLYRLLYFVSQWRPLAAFENFLMAIGNQRPLLDRLRNNPPDLIVSTYFLTAPLRAALKRLKLHIPIVVIVTDPFTVHPIWLLDRDLPHIVLSDAARQLILASHGITVEKLVAVPPLVNHRLPAGYDAERLDRFKTEHGLPKDEPIVLLVGGGNGFPKGEAMLESLLTTKLAATIVVVCGSNRKLKAAAEQLRTRSKRTVIVLGYVDYVPELIAAAQVVITKAGSGVLMEAVVQKKPIVVAHYIWGQEKGNVDFIVNKKLGFYEPNPKALALLTERLLFDANVRQSVADAYERLSFHSGNDTVVATILTSANLETEQKSAVAT